MYRSFFNLKSKPFGLTPDPAFLWLGDKYKEAISILRYGIHDNKGFLLITGDAGTGKTSLINFLTEGFDDTVEWAVINDPNKERLDFYNAIAKGFGITKEITSKVQFLIQFSNFLHKAHDEKKRVLLLIDDCHLLSQEMLEELRLLSNIEKADARLINIFFIGQREFQEMLIKPSNRAVRQRLSFKIDLAPLTADETGAYIQYRLKVAGSIEKLFSPKAITTIYQYSSGNPKQINILCDRVLAEASIKKTHNLDQKFIEECIEKLDQPFSPAEGEAGIIAEKNPRDPDFTAVSEMKAILSDINRENGRKWSWLKYGLGVATLVLVAVYLWMPPDKNPGVTGVDAKKVDAKIIKKETSQTTVSKDVTVFDKSRTVLNDIKVADLKQAILEKAYQESETANQETTVPRVTEDDEKTALLQADSRSAEIQNTTSAMVNEQAPLAPVLAPPDAGKTTSTIPSNENGAEKEVLVQDQEKIVLPPTKIILPLMPNSMQLTTEANKELTAFVKKIKRNPRANLLVKGFVSSNVDSPMNTKLSEERAVAVRKLLIAGGIETARIKVVGMGNHEPMASNNTSDGRAKNRRVEISVTDNVNDSHRGQNQ